MAVCRADFERLERLYAALRQINQAAFRTSERTAMFAGASQPQQQPPRTGAALAATRSTPASTATGV